MSQSGLHTNTGWPGNPDYATTGHYRNDMAHRVEALAQRETAASNPIISKKLMQRIILLCTGLCLLVGFMFLSANFFGDEISRGGHSAETASLRITIGQDVLIVPKNAIRFPYQRTKGLTSKLDLYRHWPSMKGYSDALKQEFNRDSGKSNLVFMTLEERTMRHDMFGRIGPIYQRFFTGNPEFLENGLIKQSLDADAGFIDEDLYFSQKSSFPFAARCVKDKAEIATPFCISDIHVGQNMMLTYRFHRRFLPQWLEMSQTIRGHVQSLVSNN